MMRALGMSLLVAWLMLLITSQLAAGEEMTKERVQRLLTDLKSDDEQTRRKAAELLCDQAAFADQILPALRHMLINDEEWHCRWQAAGAMTTFGKRGELELLEVANHKNAKVSSVAIELLGKCKTANGTTVRAVLPRINDPDPAVRRAVVNLVGDLRYVEAANDIVRVITTDRDDLVRLAAIATAGDLRDKARMMVPMLVSLLRSGRENWQRENEEDFRQTIARALGSLGREAMPFVIAELKKPNNMNPVKVDLLSAISWNSSKDEFPEAVQLAGAALNDKNVDVRCEALLLMRGLDAKPYRDRIASIIESPENSKELRRAIGAMSSLDRGDAAMHKRLKSLLSSRIAGDRKQAIGLIRRHKMEAQYRTALAGLLDDQDKDIRYDAVGALNDYLSNPPVRGTVVGGDFQAASKEDDAILKKLKKMAAQDADKDVREHALKTYQQATKKPRP